MPACRNLAEGLLVATIPLSHAFGVLTIGQVYGVAILSAAAFVFSDAAVFGAVPALVGPERLPAANGLLSSLASGSEIVGPVIAGLLVAGVGATNAVWIDAASFFAAAAVQLTIRSNFRDPTTAQQTVGTAPRVRDTIDRAFRFIRGDRSIAALLLAGFGNSFALVRCSASSCRSQWRNSASPPMTRASVCCTAPSAWAV